MEQLTVNQKNIWGMSADSALKKAVTSWVSIVLVGQWAFAVYILSLYAIPLLIGAVHQADEISPARGFDTSAGFDSIMFFSHILPAAIMATSGLAQIIPKIRKTYPKFHRWNGRLFFTLGLSGAVTGLYLTWGAGIRFSDIGALGVTLNGVLILVAIFFAWKTAVKKQFAQHQRWAVHAFILVNGVWTFRLFLMGWYLVNQGPNGNNGNLDGPMDLTLSFACYLLPMLIAELIFWAKRCKTENIKWLAAMTTSIAAVITLIGVIAAAMMMWGPRVSMVIESIF
ncbi:DUF2306 domain-containing protein [Pseudoalteromonas sp. SS15]|uniref:DUF2306 domain-containing protein n=1 Tax=Pseudoalteromonas sp. SS15 TaxID=3139393 RepID=UPI003BABA977